MAYETDRGPWRDAPLALQNQLIHTIELAACVDSCESTAANDSKICSLLDGLSDELRASIAQLRNRMSVVAPSLAMVPRHRARMQTIGAAVASNHEDLPEQIETLLIGYARLARETSEAIAVFERLFDQESIRLLNHAAAVVEKALCFLEMYLEGMASRVDTSNLPDWPRAV